MPGKVLVTGGAGFVGSNTARALLARGYEVAVFDNFDYGLREYLSDLDVEEVQGDIRDEDAVRAAAEGRDAIFHLAAYGNVIDSIADPDTNFAINVQGTLNILKAARDAEVGKFVFSSTGGALMGDTPPPVNERSAPKPISPYGASKLACEGYISAFASSYDLNAVIFRFANVYGPRSAHKKGVFNKYLTAIDQGEDLIIYGDPMRDFIFVDDLVGGLIAGLETETEKADVFHLSTNKGVRIEDFAREMLRLRGVNEDRLIRHPARKGEVAENFSENFKAVEKLGFTVSDDLTGGLRQTIDWFDGNRGLWAA